LGFRGTEDLGGGLSANFNLETGMTTTDGTLFSGAARTAIVGLSDKSMGTLQVGRQLTGLHGVVAGYNTLAGSNMVGDVLYSGEMRLHDSTTLGAQKAAVGGTNGALRVNNMLTYVSPAMNGLTARIDYAKDSRNADAAVAGKDATTDYQGLTLNYAQGPLSLSAATSTMKSKAAHVTGVTASYGILTDSGDGTTDLTVAATCTDSATVQCVLRTAAVTAVTAANDDTQAKYNAISAQYKISPALAVQASYGKNEFSSEGVKNHESSAYRLGANYQTGKWVLAAQYGAGKVKSPLADSDANLGKATEADRTAYQLAAIYNLSKRTNLYVAYGMQEQEVTKQANNAAGNGTMTTAIGDSVKTTQMAVGLRHSFYFDTGLAS
jgi:predicted porin